MGQDQWPIGFHLVESCKSCLKVFWFDLVKSEGEFHRASDTDGLAIF